MVMVSEGNSKEEFQKLGWKILIWIYLSLLYMG